MTKFVVEIDSMLEDLVPSYLENRKKEMLILRELMDKNDLSEIAKIAHKIAGNSGSYGFHEMGVMAKEIEKLSETGNAEGIPQLIEEIQTYLDKLEVKFI